MNNQTDHHNHHHEETKSEIFSYEEAQRKKKDSNQNKRRFSDEQIKLLETIFESETKLGPRKKLQLAKELGLQPRQIATWFQNRRARWKSKRIEHEFNLLKANYDQLLSCFESLKNERQSLLLQLKKLNELLGEPYDENMNYQEDYKTKISANIENTNNNNNNSFHAQDQELDKRSILMNSEDNRNREISVSRDEFTDGSLASPDQWYNFDSIGQFDKQWFDFWT